MTTRTIQEQLIEQMGDSALSIMGQIDNARESETINGAIGALSGIEEHLETCLALYRAAVAMHHRKAGN